MAEATLAASKRVEGSWLRRNWIYAPLLIGVLIMLPRLISANFGLMDDGRALSIAQGLLQGKFDLSWDVVAGRARPIYWLAFAFWYLLVGAHPFWYFLGNLIVFSTTTFLLIHLVQTLGGSKLQAFLTGFVFVLSTSVIENIYTLSKAENFQIMLMVSALSLAVLAGRASKSTQVWMLLAASSVILLVACFTKESTILLLPTGLVWWVIAWMGRKMHFPAAQFVQKTAGFVVLPSLVSAVIFYLGRTAFLSSSKILGVGQSSGYSFTAGSILDGFIRWGGWILRDFIWLIPMTLIVLVWCLVRRKLPASGLWWLALVWMGFWLGMYIPWRFAVEYYLLPFAAGTAVISGVLLAELVEMARQASVAWKSVGVISLILTGCLLLTSQANSFTDAAIQLAQDSANTRLMEYIAKNAPQNGRVVVNLQIANEYIEQMQLTLAITYKRPDLQLVNYSGEDLARLKSTTPGLFFVVAELANQPKMTVRMGLDEPSLKTWNAAVMPELATWNKVFQVSESPHILPVNFPRLLCAIVNRGSYCSASEPLVDPSHLFYQWSVYTP
ncbi:MAG: hypothetical protein C3F13_13275 [Anaerolineales bacterium]|nr:hypothetical protein [Anaerolineae bacterium]PWB51408.1 MAG: hypothetical protein C3F13_13275 [Anaerolineales bacterium]